MSTPGFASPEAIERFRHLQPHLEEDVPSSRIASAGDVTERTLRRWLAAYRADGIRGLERTRRNDAGMRRALAPDLEALIRNLATRRPRSTIAAIHRKILAEARAQKIAGPSYSVVADVVRGIGPGRIALATDAAGYRDRHELVHRRKAGASGEMWQADHTVLDVVLQGDRAAPVRPWLTVVLDDHSRAVAGYLLTTDAPSAMNTALALRQALRRKDDPARPLGRHPRAALRGQRQRLRLRACRAGLHRARDPRRPFAARPAPRALAKIERLFRTTRRHVPPRRAGAPHRGQAALAPSIGLAELTARFERFLHDVCQHRMHGTTGEAPVARWQAGGFLPALPESREALDMLLLRVPKPRKVARDGIRFMGRRYVEPTLAAFVGELVDVLYDPRDLAEVHVHHEGTFVCRALCPEHVDAPSLAMIRSARRRAKETLKHSVAADEVRHEHHECPQADRPRPDPRFGGLRLYATDD